MEQQIDLEKFRTEYNDLRAENQKLLSVLHELYQEFEIQAPSGSYDVIGKVRPILRAKGRELRFEVWLDSFYEHLSKLSGQSVGAIKTYGWDKSELKKQFFNGDQATDAAQAEYECWDI